ncbi:hypothetical protein CsatB_010828 [Cannabis sativa]
MSDNENVLFEEDNDRLLLDDDDGDLSEIDDRWCLVGRFLTKRSIDCQAMQHKKASLWQPNRGLYVKELDPNHFLFQFYHEIDITRVIDSSPWTFDRVPLIFERVKVGENPRQITLTRLDVWIQCHEMKTGFMSENTLKHMANYIGTFVKSDPNNFTGVWRDYLRVRTTINVEKPLKKKMTLERKNGQTCTVQFKYEDLPTFCFICGVLGHSERFCDRLFDTPAELIKKMFDLSLKAAPRRRQHTIGSPWLRSGANYRGPVTGGGESTQAGVSRNIHGEENNQGLIANLHNIGNPQQIIRGDVPHFVEKDPKAKDKSIQGGNDVASEVILSNNALLVVENKRRRTDVAKELGESVDGPNTPLVGLGNISNDNGIFEMLDQDNHIDMKVAALDGSWWRLTGVYGEPIRNQREQTWTLLKTLKSNSTLPWCVIGDLNNVLSQEDKKGGRPYPQWLLQGFQVCLDECGLEDLELLGYPFTWERGRGTRDWIEVCLDRALVTNSWRTLFPEACLSNLEASTSDHCPIFLEPTVRVSFRTPRRFRFENAWLSEPMCYQLVQDCWDTQSHESISGKISKCAEVLARWGKEVTGDFKARIKHCKTTMSILKPKMDAESVKQYDEARNRLFEVLEQRETFWKQRAKQFWLKGGDKNSKYFHKTASSRKQHNTILQLKDDHGTWVDWNNGLANMINAYYTSLFATANTRCQEVIDSVSAMVSTQANEELSKPVSEEEVRKAIFQMHPDKSPGPDGMTPAFYQKCWQIVKRDVTRTVQHFFEHGVLEDGCGEANIVLIPKKKNPQHMKDLRPIALCNVLYKVITKVMTNRMKPFMSEIIADSQSAFVPGRLISDNVLVSFEVLHYLKRKRKGKTSFMALKLDMSKAYDRIEWPFLEAMLRKMGFVENWIRLIMTCVSTARYKVIHDAYEVGPICPSRGIRQGDPLSPYLFIICAEGLSSLLYKYERNGWIHGCKVANGAPRISHMLFADDSYLYCKATLQEAQRIQELLHKFESASGQQVNFAKSSIFFSLNTDHPTQMHICNYLHMAVADEGSFYLGLPSTMSRNKTSVLGFLRDKVKKRLQSWEGKFLSKGGKEVLIKSVVQALPSYAMNVFLLPLEISNDIERAMCKFWWKSSQDENKGIHWMAWDKLCLHKRGGGMGFRNLRDFNLSLLGKQGWRMLTRPQSLASRLFKARYFPNGNFLNAQLGSNPSFVWRSILESQSLLKHGIRWCVGDGTRIQITGEPWLPHEENPKVISSHPSLITATVNSLMKPGELTWDDEILNDLFEERDRTLIKAIPLNITQTFDHLVWSKENSGTFSVKSAYALLQKLKGNWFDDAGDVFWRKLWQLKLPSKMQNLVWRACNNCLPTVVQLRTKRVDVSPLCPICHIEQETILHALVTCREVSKCWDRVGIGTSVAPGAGFFDWCSAVFCNKPAAVICRVVAVCWAVWGARNNLVWNKKPFIFEDVVAYAFRYLDQWKAAQISSDSSWPILTAADVSEQWTPPNGTSVKINVDAAMFNDGRSFGLGMVARNSDGLLIAGKMKYTAVQVEVAVAEAIGIRKVLSWLKENRWPQVYIETDSLCVVQAIHSSTDMISLFGSVIQDCKTMLASLNNVVISFVKRSVNVVAHSFARAARLYPDCTCSLETVPTELLPCLVADVRV